MVRYIFEFNATAQFRLQHMVREKMRSYSKMIPYDISYQHTDQVVMTGEMAKVFCSLTELQSLQRSQIRLKSPVISGANFR